MASLEELAALLGRLLPARPDGCLNGLQVEGGPRVRVLALGVTLSRELVLRARALGADALLVHHGFFGRGRFRAAGPAAARLSLLLEADMSLFGFHLPLDAQPELGHNACLAGALGLEGLEPRDVGLLGRNARRLSCAQIEGRLRAYLGEGERAWRERERAALESRGLPPPPGPAEPEGLAWPRRASFLRGPDHVPEAVLVCSGGSSSLVRELRPGEAELFVLGEPSASLEDEAAARGCSTLCLGHWRTEQPGLWALAERLEAELPGLRCVYCGVPGWV